MKKLALFGLLLLTTISVAKIVPEKKDQAKIRLIDSLLANNHYQSAVLDDKKSKEILNKYIEFMDYGKFFFTKNDIKAFHRYDTLLDDFAHKGELSPVFDMYNTLLQKRQQRIAWSLARLEKPISDDVPSKIQLDRKKMDWAKNENELKQRWEKRLLNEWVTLRLAKQSDEKARQVLKKRYTNITKRINQLKEDEVFQLYANAVTSVYDPHTSYFSPHRSETFDINMSLSLEGIGAMLAVEEDVITIKELIPGGPAKKSGKLSPNDKILGVAQGKTGVMQDIVGWRSDDAVDLIRGKRGTIVRLQIQQAMSDEITEITLVRDKIKLEESAAKSDIKKFYIEGKTYKIGVINLPSFYIDFEAARRGDKNYRSTTRDVKKLIKQLEIDGIDGLMIDLRNDGGGSLAEAVSLTGLFFDSGPVVQVRRSPSDVQVQEDDDGKTFYKGPLAVLVNQNSASASEIFTGAIKDYHRGVILGEPTFGKGTVQTIIDLSNFLPSIKEKVGQLKMTIAMFYRVNGSSTQLKGVKPDLYIPNKESHMEGGESKEENALPWQTIGAVKHDIFPLVSPTIVKQLQLDYYANNSKNPLMKNLVSLMMWQKAQIKDTIIPLSLKKRQNQRQVLRKKRLSFENKFRKIYDYPLLKVSYLDKKDSEKTAEEKSSDKQYKIDAILDIAVRTV
ncbi:MAG: carboxy terminal-processing peptidase, partial [Ostreibacterium sp.]